MYRAVTFLALERGLDVRDEAAITALAESIQVDVLPASRDDGRLYDVLVEDRDVTWEIRHADVDANVSMVSAYPGVRHALLPQQRRVGQRGHVVMVGRDIGTVVLPEADLKVYLDASAEERARRRYDESRARGGAENYEEILAKVKARDRFDSTRKVAPLRPAPDAIILDSDQLGADEVLARIHELLR